VLTRATSQIEGHVTPWWFYFKVLLVAAPPFVLLYPAAVAQALKESRLRVFALFALVELAFFSVVATRLPQYIVPMYPALAVVTAVWLADRVRPLLAARRATTPRLVLAAALVSVAAVWATAPARKTLHSANAAGVPASDSRDSTALLRNRPEAIDGPLLVWHADRVMSMPTIVFYARRPVEQVQLVPLVSEPLQDRYTFDPQPVAEAITNQPRLILLDRSLVARIPAGFSYTPIETRGEMELGTIARTP
jgi:hypothetical protein